MSLCLYSNSVGAVEHISVENEGCENKVASWMLDKG